MQAGTFHHQSKEESRHDQPCVLHAVFRVEQFLCRFHDTQRTAGKEEHHGYDHAVEVLGTCLSERMPFANFCFCLPIAHQQEYLIAAVHDAVDRFVQHGGRPGDRKSHELRYGYQYVGS